MSRTYPNGYSISILITKYASGPWARIVLVEEDGASPQRLQGFLTRDALADVEALTFALVSEIQGPVDHLDPF